MCGRYFPSLFSLATPQTPIRVDQVILKKTASVCILYTRTCRCVSAPSHIRKRVQMHLPMYVLSPRLERSHACLRVDERNAARDTTDTTVFSPKKKPKHSGGSTEESSSTELSQRCGRGSVGEDSSGFRFIRRRVCTTWQSVHTRPSSASSEGQRRKGREEFLAVLFAGLKKPSLLVYIRIMACT